MTALSKLLVLLVIFLSGRNANAFTSLSPVADNQVRVNHLILLSQVANQSMIESMMKQQIKQSNMHFFLATFHQRKLK
jgi:hypothetical protein